MKDAGSVPYRRIVFDDILGERNGSFLGQSLQSLTPPSRVYLIYMREKACLRNL